METLLGIISVVNTALYYSFFISWHTGKFIITTGYEVLLWLNTGAKYLFATLKVFLEDFHPFAADILEHLHLIVKCIRFSSEGVLNIFYGIYFWTSAFINGVLHCVLLTYSAFVNVFISVIEVFAFIKRVLILFGSGVWFLLTLIPLSLMTFFIYSTYCFGLLLEETTNLISTSYNNVVAFLFSIYDFVTDVPVESLIGLTVAICLIYIFVQFHIELYRFFQHKLREFIELIRRNLLTFRFSFPKNFIRRTSAQHTEEEEVRDPEETINEAKFCVICQERAKNVLLLPCKHVCLCTHCEYRLKNYGYKCPVCRTHVRETMKVFI